MGRVKSSLLVVSVLCLGACSTTVSLSPAENAAEPVCAQVLFATPDEIGGIPRSQTTAQSTTAWGDAITLRCGLEPPPPSTDRCVTVGNVDLLSLDASDPRVPAYGKDNAWTFLTYGRDPAIEIVVSAEAVGDRAVTDVVAELSSAIELIDADHMCVGVDEAP